MGLVLSIGILYHFKYYPILAPIISNYFYIAPDKYSNITVPLGISFITFSAISYFVDIYRDDAKAGSFFDCLLYILFFPKVVSGPIALWKEFLPQIKKRKPTSLDSFVEGVNLIAIGFAKKVIFADTFGLHADQIKGQCIDAPTAWLGWLLYAFQIYYDFAGYSDIAIGLSRMFGFHLDNNFDFPYRSLSITEFWRRWHISLGSFFRNYIYIPLGGNRKGIHRTLVNLFIVFLITGIWHGSGMAYIIWGILHGLCVVFERTIKDKKWYIKCPWFFKWLATFFVSASAWQFFRYGGNGVAAFAAMAQMLGIHNSYTAADITFSWRYYANNKTLVLLLIAFAGATLPGDKRVRALYEKCEKNKVFYFAQEFMLLCLFIISITFMISSSYSPFIYFQF